MDLTQHGAWDANLCTTVLIEQDQTVCECRTFGSVSIVAEMVERPSLPPEDKWVTVVKYVGFCVSIVSLLVYVTVIITSS